MPLLKPVTSSTNFTRSVSQVRLGVGTTRGGVWFRHIVRVPAVEDLYAQTMSVATIHWQEPDQNFIYFESLVNPKYVS